MISAFKNLSIGKKISIILLFTTFSAMMAMSIALWHYQTHSYQDNLKANLLSNAKIIADNSASSIIFEDQATAQEILTSLEHIPGFTFALLHDQNKTILAKTSADSSVSYDLLQKLYEDNLPESAASKTLGTVLLNRGSVFINQPIIYQEMEIGCLHMIFSLEPLAQQRIHLAKFLLLIFIITMISVIMVGTRLQRIISTPLIKLSKTAASVAEEKNYALRVDVTSRDETGRLTESFNAVLSTIQQHEEDLNKALDESSRATKAKSQFLANMSHEIRTPMNGIIGMAELMKDGKLSSDQRDNLNIIQHSAEQLLSIINEILDFSKVESGSISLDNDPFDLPRVLNGISQMLSPTASRKGLTIGPVIGESVPGRVSGDSVRIRQILLNLAGNAIKFTKEGCIEVGVQQLAADNGMAKLRFEVKDQGIGIPVDQQNKIFSQFTQVDDSNTRSYGGTGLGLAISKLLVELMGGEIGVTSEEGKGSTFWFEIEMPIIEAKQSKESAHTEELSGSTPSTGGTLGKRSTMAENFPESRILLAEDNITNQIVISRTLKKLGCLVDIAENGKEAVAMLRNAPIPYDLVYMDCHMPVMDGYEATSIIRSLAGSVANTPVVALTASAMPEDKAKAEAAKMDDYLTKPIQILTLRHSLKKWVWEKQDDQIRILVAEDNPTNQRIVMRTLEKLGHLVDVAADGALAVEQLKTASIPYNIIFMDCHMPNMDGYEATRTIRKIPGDIGKIPIIALTAASTQEDIDKSLNSGMNAHLTKPAKKKLLQESIEQWVQQDNVIEC